MANGMTIIEKYDALINLITEGGLGDTALGEGTVLSFLEDRKERSKSNSKNKGDFALNDEQKAIVDEVARILTESGVPMTIGEIIKASDYIREKEYTSPKVTNAVTKMTINADKKPNPNGIFVRSVDKKTAKYSMAVKENEE